MRYGVYAPIPRVVRGVTKWSSRSGTPIRSVTIHRMDGSLEGSDSWLRSPYSGSASTHFAVGLWNGVPQIRCWVDTAFSAYGWAATPTDRPTPLGLKVFGDLLYHTSRWPGYASRIDLNRATIAIEVEGFHYQPWDPRVTAKVRELLTVLAKAHGPLWVTAHTDLSSKPCPGMTTFQRALPGVYGSRLSKPATTIPKPPAPKPTEVDVNLTDITIPGDSGRLFDVRKGVTLYKDAAHTKVHFRTTVPVKYRLIGFHSNGDVLASSATSVGGNPFLVPANH